MAEITLRDAAVIRDYGRPYFIAEVNSSHNGDIDVAQAMIREAKDAGCSCVKFQSWSAESLYSKTHYQKNAIAQRIINKFSLPETGLKELASYCGEVGIAFSSTPYSPREVDFLLKCNAPYIKVASMEINNLHYLRYVAETGAPIVLSTGMAEIEEIQRAVSVIRECGNKNLALLHCVSMYPTPPSGIHLHNIPMLRQEFPECPVGFSDHTLGVEIAAAATALGAAIVEKHFTLDKNKMGMDNNMAIEPPEMKQLIQNCCNVYEALGSYKRIVSEAEYEQRAKMRRSVIVVKDLCAGTILKRADLDAKRPGDGIPVHQLDSLVGRRLASDVEADALLRLADLAE